MFQDDKRLIHIIFPPPPLNFLVLSFSLYHYNDNVLSSSSSSFFEVLGGSFTIFIFFHQYMFTKNGMQFIFLCQLLLGMYRLQAHAKVESVKSKIAAEERRIKKKRWFSFRWYVVTPLFLCILITLDCFASYFCL